MNDVKAALLSVCIALVLVLPDESSANGLKLAGAAQILQEPPKDFEASEHDAPCNTAPHRRFTEAWHGVPKAWVTTWTLGEPGGLGGRRNVPGFERASQGQNECKASPYRSRPRHFLLKNPPQ